MRKLGCSLALVAGLLCVGRGAAADEPSGQSLFDAGQAAMKDKRYTPACAAFRQSFRREARAETLYWVAKCEDAAGRVTSAAAAYDDYLALYDRLSSAERAAERTREKEAAARRAALEGRIPHITFRLRGSADGVRVTRRLDGGDEVDVALGVPLPIDPGEHFVSTAAPDRARWEKRFFVAEGERRTIDLEIAPIDKSSGLRFTKPIAPVPNLLPPLDPGPSGQRIAAFVAGGIGFAGLIVGGVTGAVTWGQKGTIEDNCKKPYCNLDGQGAADRAKTFGVVSTASFVLGGIALATGVILYVTEPGRPKLGALPGRVAIDLRGGPGGAALVTQWTF